MRVLLDVTFSTRAPFSGTAIYLERLQDALAGEGIEVVPAANRRRPAPAGGGAGSVRNLLVDRWWTAVELPRLARRARADVIHHPLPACARGCRTPQVMTVHDLAFERVPECFDRAYRIYAHRYHRAAALAAGAVICVSETTAADVRALWGIAGERIVVALHGPGQEARPERGQVGREREGEPGREREQVLPEYFLYVGDDEQRKNLSTLLSAYRMYRERADSPLALVLAGSVEPRGVEPRGVEPPRGISRSRRGARGGTDRNGPGVRIEQHPGPERLAQLYAGAVALVHPSLYEGFGLTALEAMSAGTPVIAASSPGLVEVCGDAALYADPRDAASFAVAMGEVGASGPLRRALAARGIARAAALSWRASARAHAAAYSLALRR